MHYMCMIGIVYMISEATGVGGMWLHVREFEGGGGGLGGGSVGVCWIWERVLM